MVYIGSITIKLLRVILIYHSIVSYIWFMCLLFYSFFLHSFNHPVVMSWFFRSSSSAAATTHFTLLRSRAAYSLEKHFYSKSLSMFALFMMLIASVYIHSESVFLFVYRTIAAAIAGFASQSMIIEILQHVHNPNRNINVLHFDSDRLCSFVLPLYRSATIGRSVTGHGRPPACTFQPKTVIGHLFYNCEWMAVFCLFILRIFSSRHTFMDDFHFFSRSLGFSIESLEAYNNVNFSLYHWNRIIYSRHRYSYLLWPFRSSVLFIALSIGPKKGCTIQKANFRWQTFDSDVQSR